MAITTITKPARIARDGVVNSPLLTTAPRPPPPISPPMTTMESANRIVWLTPSRIIRRASGSCTFVRIWRVVVPIDVAASTVLTGTPRMPERGDPHGGGIA